MTVDTRGGRPRELLIDVALFAVHALVRPGQREIRSAVVEGCRIPVGRSVAGGTIRAEFARVFIVLGMAGITV